MVYKINGNDILYRTEIIKKQRKLREYVLDMYLLLACYVYIFYCSFNAVELAR